jgi:hypothetical protein
MLRGISSQFCTEREREALSSEMTGFPWERKHGVAGRGGAASARDPTAPLVLTNLGLVLVRDPDRPGSPG